MHLSMSSRQGGRQGIGQDFDIFPKIAVKFPTPGQKCEVKYNQISHPEKWFVVTGKNKNSDIPTSGTARKFKCLPPGQSDQSKSHPMPHLPPGRFDIDRCIKANSK